MLFIVKYPLWASHNVCAVTWRVGEGSSPNRDHAIVGLKGSCWMDFSFVAEYFSRDQRVEEFEGPDERNHHGSNGAD